MPLSHLILIILLCAATPARASSWSGLYLGYSKKNSYIALQLVETTGNNVIGRYRQVVVTEIDAKTDFDAPVSGAVHGDQIIGRIERSWIQGGVIAFSGTRTNSGIRLSGGDGLQGSLVSSTAQDEQMAISELTVRAKQAGDSMRAVKAHQDEDRRAKSGLTNIDTALRQAEEFQLRGVKTVAALGKVPAHYETITARQEQMAAYARTLSDSVARSQVSVAIIQLTVEKIIGTKVEVDRSVWHAETARNSVLRILSIAKNTCSQRNPKGQYETHYLAKCQLIPAAAKATEKLSDTMKALFKHLDDAFEVAEERGNTLSAELDMLR